MLYGVSDRETIDDVSTSGGVAITSTLLAAAGGHNMAYAIIQAIDDPIRFTIDGTEPVADTTGLRLLEDESVEIWGKDAMANFLCIDDGGTAKLEVIIMASGV